MSVFDRLTGGPDPQRVRDEMLSLKEPERRKRAKAASHDFREVALRGGRDRPSPRWRAAALAWVGTATARTIASEFWRIGSELEREPELADDVYAVLASRGRAFYETLARRLVAEDGFWGGWKLVRRGVRDGLIEPPPGEDYVRGLVFGVVTLYGESPPLVPVLLADPKLLEREVWQLFEIDAGPELSNAGDRWTDALTQLARDGQLDRTRLLDASLDALLRDFRPSSVGWYAELHERLAPTREERLERLDRYLALVTSPAPAVVKEGLAALRAVEDAVPPESFARVAPTPFTQRQKNLATETLSMLARLCKLHPDARPVLLEAAAEALAHERADVQERALKLLEQYRDDVPRAVVLGYSETVSPTLAPRLEALTGVVVADAAPVVVDRLPEPRVPEPAPEEPLQPVRDVDELIELAAALLEGHGSGDDGERFLDGVSRLCNERPPRFGERTEGLVKRAGEHDEWRRSPSSGGELVATVVRAWARGVRPTTTPPTRTLAGLLAERALEVADRAARKRPHALLAFPTHRGGWVDGAALKAREKPARNLFARRSADHHDRLGARLRTVRDVRVDLTPIFDSTGEATRVELVRGALPPEVADVPEVATSLEKHGRSSFHWWQSDTIWLSDDRLGARWLLTILPALPEIQFGRALIAVVDRIDATVYRNPEAVLEHALDPGVPLRDPAWDLAAASLLAKAPDLQRLAVDLLVGSVDDGRYDARKLGRGLARLLDNGVGAALRLAPPLRDAGRSGPLHAAQVVRGIEGLLGHLETTPRGLHALLEVALENGTATGRRVEDAQARATLERLAADVSRSSKLGKLTRSLLDAR